MKIEVTEITVTCVCGSTWASPGANGLEECLDCGREYYPFVVASITEKRDLGGIPKRDVEENSESEISAEEYLRRVGSTSDYPTEMLAPGLAEETRQTVQIAQFKIPGPPAYLLNPNARVHYYDKSAESAAARTAAKFSCPNVAIPGPVRISWSVFLGKDRKVLDRDNMMACLKPMQDGIVDAGLIDGDTPTVIVEDPKLEQILYKHHGMGPHVIVTIEAAT